MNRRKQLHKIFANIEGVEKVYFQPPESVKMVYPCIRYATNSDFNRRADNILYNHRIMYLVTVIDKNPDSIIPDALRVLPYCEFERSYIADNLNHWVFTIYY